MRQFNVCLLAAAALGSLANAQLPHECFFESQSHGSRPTDYLGFKLSDLPTLTRKFRPGMVLKSITGFKTEDNKELTGLQITLEDRKSDEILDLPIVGLVDQWFNKTEVELSSQPADRISILSDTRGRGICDVVVYQGHKATSLHPEVMDCRAEIKDIEEVMVGIDEEFPLVGFHADVNIIGLSNLGLIFADTTTPNCRFAHSASEFEDMDDLTDREQSYILESQLTVEERQRADALEAILRYDFLKNLQHSKGEIEKKLLELVAASPVEAMGDKPASIEELQSVFDRLAENDLAYNKENFAEIEAQLLNAYAFLDTAENGDDEEVRVPVGYVYNAYTDLVDTYGGLDIWGPEPNMDENRPAVVYEVELLLQKIEEHINDDGELEQLSMAEMSGLMVVFSKLADHYATRALAEPLMRAEYERLSNLYDDMAELMGKESDFKMDPDMIAELFSKMQNDEEIDMKIEGQIIKGFKDLQELTTQQEDERIDALLLKMNKMEKSEDLEQQELDHIQVGLEKELQEIFRVTQDDQQRLANVEQLLKDQAHVDREAEQQIKRDSIDASVETETSKLQSVTEEEQPAQASVQDLTRQFMNVLVMYAIFGAVFGGICVFAIMKCCNKSRQTVVLESAFKTDDIENNNERRASIRSQRRASLAHTGTEEVLQRGDSAQIDGDEEEGPNMGIHPSDLIAEHKAAMAAAPQVPEVPVGTEQNLYTENDDGENDIPGFLTSRGLDFEKPMDRRCTTTHKKSSTDIINQNDRRSTVKRIGSMQ